MNSEKEEAVRNTLTRMEQMFTNPTFKLFQELFTEDCDYITFDGQHLKGIQANYEAHLQLSSFWIFKGVRLVGKIISLKFINENTAIVISKGALVFRWQKGASTSRMSINTNVLVLHGDRWKVCSFQNTRIKPPSLFIRLFGKA
jgi:uncharacterized protein (TIGR02246 family)